LEYPRPAFDTDWRRHDPSLSFDSLELKEMLALWEKRRGDRPVPARSDFDSVDLIRFGGRILLIDVEYAPRRYRFRLIGTFAVEMLKRDMTGRYLDELYPGEQYRELVKSLEYCIDKKRPMRTQTRMVYADREHILAEVLDMPLSSDGETVDMIWKAVDYARPSA
jgi:hypothetical protein